jgi:hypothetical protein
MLAVSDRVAELLRLDGRERELVLAALARESLHEAIP